MLCPTRENSSRRSGLGRSQDRVCATTTMETALYNIILLLLLLYGDAADSTLLKLRRNWTD